MPSARTKFIWITARSDLMFLQIIVTLSHNQYVWNTVEIVTSVQLTIKRISVWLQTFCIIIFMSHEQKSQNIKRIWTLGKFRYAQYANPCGDDVGCSRFGKSGVCLVNPQLTKNDNCNKIPTQTNTVERIVNSRSTILTVMLRK